MAEPNPRETGVIRTLFAQNWLTVFGASLTTASFILIAALVVVGALGGVDSPYIGIVAFLILPGMFVVGLIIIPVGALWQRWRLRQAAGAAEALTIDLRRRHTRRALGLLFFLTAANLFIISSVTYRGVLYMDSVEFCGKVCHTVMEPEHTAFLNSPHGRVHCVECHIGPGAPWFVRSKLSGARQVFAVMFHTYSTPIPTPVENLRPSRDTCEQCHWPQKFSGDRMKVTREFSEDETNTRLTTALLMHIGGGHSDTHGIHSWHIAPGRETYYLPTSEDRQTLSLVRVKEPDGVIKNFATPDFQGDPATVPNEQMRLMDCIDCHNRPTHVYQLPGDAMDEAMTAARIDPALPSIKQVGVEALQAAAEAPTQEAGIEQIAQRIKQYYQENHSDALTAQSGALDAAIKEMQAIYQRNVFPQMKVTWGTYPNNIGHEPFPGCFRCHDETHATADGDTISQDCTICHAVLAWQEPEPEVLTTLGIQ
ncbi:MAG: NapC/NirT family cytochrome c [Candidatus Hydrogenedentes bacterium]|nr:NapC/NirT family cytochrome c [Candidatus Hydrogenedentota bacterium]